jgi:hypothetical protein
MPTSKAKLYQSLMNQCQRQPSAMKEQDERERLKPEIKSYDFVIKASTAASLSAQQSCSKGNEFVDSWSCRR